MIYLRSVKALLERFASLAHYQNLYKNNKIEKEVSQTFTISTHKSQFTKLFRIGCLEVTLELAERVSHRDRLLAQEKQLNLKNTRALLKFTAKNHISRKYKLLIRANVEIFEPLL